jgi:hypothetical protein
MNLRRGRAIGPVVFHGILGAGLSLVTAIGVAAQQPDPLQFASLPPSARQPASAAFGGQPGPVTRLPVATCEDASLGSPFIPVDSWVYPAVLRLYSLGFLDHVFLNMRPWPRASIRHMLEDTADQLEGADPGPVTDQAQELYDALERELRSDTAGPCSAHKGSTTVESVYTVARAITGTPLRDSYHLGSTLINDYGRPYAHGFNNYSGMSGYASAGRFTLYARGEFQGAPSATGYSASLAQALSANDGVPYLNPVTGLPFNQATIPMGPIASIKDGRVMEAYVSAHVLNHEISFGKQDDWLGPAVGGSMAYSNNAENIYSFRINRVEPLHIPGLSIVTGPFRYEFLVGSLKGHVAPNDPWTHVEKISFRPTSNLEFGFERTVIWGGKGHEPITLHTFIKSFFSLANVTNAIKASRNDPGARFGAFDFSYRLPFFHNSLTLYADSEVHDDVSPIDAPRRASWRPGLYLSHVPGAPRLDVRVEAVSTDPPVTRSLHGSFMYYETIQVQGYTNKGQLFGDWMGREDKGGQAWITYHLSGNEWIQVGARNQKAAKDFIWNPVTGTEYGTTLNDISFQGVKRIGRDFEINGTFTYERYKAPIYVPVQQTVTTTNIQLTWYPGRKVSF